MRICSGENEHEWYWEGGGGYCVGILGIEEQKKLFLSKIDTIIAYLYGSS